MFAIGIALIFVGFLLMFISGNKLRKEICTGLFGKHPHGYYDEDDEQ